MRFLRALYFLLLLGLALPLAAADAKNGKLIKKCQDASGKWHYGDNAAEECAKSKVTEISQQGMKKKETAAPASEEELEARERRREELEQEGKRVEARKRRDQLLLSTYDHEDDINFTRDRKLAQLETSIKASEDTLKSLRGALARLETQAAEESRGGKAVSPQTAKGIAQTGNQIAAHEAAIQTTRKEQEAIRKQAAADLERYRELKQGQASRTTAPAAKRP